MRVSAHDKTKGISVILTKPGGGRLDEGPLCWGIWNMQLQQTV